MMKPLTPRPAATLLLLRDGKAGPEVLMLKRTASAVFMPEYYVFPGGAVETADAGLPDSCLAGKAVGTSSDSRTSEDVGYRVAAIRESFEEAGVLLAVDANAATLAAHHPALSYRRQIMRGDIALQTLCERFELQLMTQVLHYLDRWVTPEGHSRRFDTRFFAAIAPVAQVASEDGSETTDHVWITPRQALADADAGGRLLGRPTLAVLRQLQGHESAEAILAAGALPASEASHGHDEMAG